MHIHANACMRMYAWKYVYICLHACNIRVDSEKCVCVCLSVAMPSQTFLVHHITIHTQARAENHVRTASMAARVIMGTQHTKSIAQGSRTTRHTCMRTYVYMYRLSP